MRPFLYRCPNTGQRVQAYTTDDLDADLTFGQELSISSAPPPSRAAESISKVSGARL
jgi:hypothetical protein